MKPKRIYSPEQKAKRAATAAAKYHSNVEAGRAKSRATAARLRRRLGQLTMAEYRAAVAAEAAKRAQKRQAEIAERREQKRRETLSRQAALKGERNARQREQQKVWREANRERARALVRAWREKNPDRCRDDRKSRKIAKRQGTIKALTKLQRGRCAICRERLGADIHIDHIMPKKLGGSNARSNLQLTCPPCNLTKNAQHPADHARSLGRLI